MNTTEKQYYDSIFAQTYERVIKEDLSALNNLLEVAEKVFATVRSLDQTEDTRKSCQFAVVVIDAVKTAIVDKILNPV